MTEWNTRRHYFPFTFYCAQQGWYMGRAHFERNKPCAFAKKKTERADIFAQGCIIKIFNDPNNIVGDRLILSICCINVFPNRFIKP